MKKSLKYVLLLVLTMSPVLTTVSCKFNYQNKIIEGNNAVLDDFVATTSRITKAFVLNKVKQWEPNQVINKALEEKEGTATVKNIAFSYFGQNSVDKWNPEYQDFFVNNQIANNIIDPNVEYINPDKGLSNQNKIFKLIKQILSVANTLDSETIKVNINSSLVEDAIKSFVTTDKVNEFWTYYQANKFSESFTNLTADITRHNQWIDQQTRYSDVLDWSTKRIKETILKVGCNGLSDDFCQNGDSTQLDTKYTSLMEKFIVISFNSDGTPQVEFDEQIKKNFTDGFVKLENILPLIVPAISLISYLITSVNDLPLTNPNIVYDGGFPSEITTYVSDKLDSSYEGLNSVQTAKIKTTLQTILSTTDEGLGLRKLLVILESTPSLTKMFEWLKIGIPLLQPLAFNTDLSAIDKSIGPIFTFAFTKIKSFLEDSSNTGANIYQMILRFIDYIPESAKLDSLDLNNVLQQASLLISKINNDVLTQANVDDISENIGNDQLSTIIFGILGYNKSDNLIDNNGFVKLLLQVISNGDVETLLNLTSSENGILSEIIKDNDTIIATSYLDWYQNSNYWTTSNKSMKYNSIDDSLEVTYDIKFEKDDIATVFQVTWKTVDYKKSTINNFKIIAFNKQK